MNIILPLDSLLTWLLVSVRLLAMLTVAPLFGHTAINQRIRLIFALAIAWVIAPGVDYEIDFDTISVAGLASTMIVEILVGVAMGFLGQLIFSAFGLLGEFISIQGGLGAARTLDPASGASSVALAAAFQTFALLTYLAIGGHHILIAGVANSFERLPIGGGMPPENAFLQIVSMGSVIFDTAARLALPVTVALLVSNTGLGLLGRAIPQLNLMTLQLPAHIAMLMVLVSLGAHALTVSMADSLVSWTEAVAPVVAGDLP